jgi:hypothetical protein
MSRAPALRPVDRMEMRLMRESGVELKDCASYFGVSVATACRVLADLRKKLGPEKFKGSQARHAEQRARAHLFVSNAREEPNNLNNE